MALNAGHTGCFDLLVLASVAWITLPFDKPDHFVSIVLPRMIEGARAADAQNLRPTGGDLSPVGFVFRRRG